MKPIWDKGRGSVKGLHLRMGADGQSGSFLFYYRARSTRTQRRPKIGSFPDINWAEARRRAGALASRVAIGEDPQGDWDEGRKEMTVSALYSQCLQDHWGQPRFTRSKHRATVENLWANHLLREFGALRLSEVTPSLIRSWHARKAGVPYSGNRALEVLRRLFSFAEEREIRPRGANPCTRIPRHTEVSRERVASGEELRRIMSVIDRQLEAGKVTEVTFLLVLIYTGARPVSLLRARWGQLQVEGGAGVLRFEGKSTQQTGKIERVVFPPQAIEALRRLPLGKPSDPIFNLHQGTLHQWWTRVRREAQCLDLRMYDLRRTFATVGFNHGVSKGIVGQLLNHSSERTTSTYARLDHTVRISAAAEIGCRIQELLSQAGEDDPYS